MTLKWIFVFFLCWASSSASVHDSLSQLQEPFTKPKIAARALTWTLNTFWKLRLAKICMCTYTHSQQWTKINKKKETWKKWMLLTNRIRNSCQELENVSKLYFSCAANWSCFSFFFVFYCFSCMLLRDFWWQVCCIEDTHTHTHMHRWIYRCMCVERTIQIRWIPSSLNAKEFKVKENYMKCAEKFQLLKWVKHKRSHWQGTHSHTATMEHKRNTADEVIHQYVCVCVYFLSLSMQDITATYVAQYQCSIVQ